MRRRKREKNGKCSQRILKKFASDKGNRITIGKGRRKERRERQRQRDRQTDRKIEKDRRQSWKAELGAWPGRCLVKTAAI